MSAAARPVGAAAPAGAEVPVWDSLVRIGHGAPVLAVATAWLGHEGPAVLHDNAGHLALAIVLVRVLWGFPGPARARFSDFVRGPRAILAYARALRAGSEPRFHGHNPLGAWMILALLSTVAVAGVSGRLSTTETCWESEPLEALHEGAANLLLLLIALHVAGVIFTSLRHRENLVLAMINGRKRAP